MITVILAKLIEFYCLLIIIYVLLSWFPAGTGILGDINSVLGKICDPYLDLFKRIVPPIGGFLDISPIFALLVLQIAERLIIQFLGALF